MTGDDVSVPARDPEPALLRSHGAQYLMIAGKLGQARNAVRAGQIALAAALVRDRYRL